MLALVETERIELNITPLASLFPNTVLRDIWQIPLGFAESDPERLRQKEKACKAHLFFLVETERIELLTLRMRTVRSPS